MSQQPPEPPAGEDQRRVPISKQHLTAPASENRAGCLILGAVLGVLAGAVFTIFVLPRLLA